jgi:hypothetical protein
MPRIAVPLTIAVLAAALLGGCGSSSDGGTGTQTATGSGSASGTPAQSGAAPGGASAQSCGNTTVTGTSGLRVTGVGCPVGRAVVAAWSQEGSCSAADSRPACTVSGYRCIGARTDAGIAVSCAQPGRSLSFVARPG